MFPGLVAFLYVLVSGPLFEEPGWRGFALPHLQTHWGPLAGSVILGFLWAAWHFTEYLVSPDFAATNGGWTPQGIGVYVLVLISISVIITWVFNHTRGSLLLAILLHTAVNNAHDFVGGHDPAIPAPLVCVRVPDLPDFDTDHIDKHEPAQLAE